MDRSDPQMPRTPPTAPSLTDSAFKRRVMRLHRLTVYGRWLMVLFFWVTVGSLSLWGWRYEISLLQEYFTWSAVRYGIIFNPLPAMGLGFCIGVTLAVLFWHSRNILLGLSPQEQQRLEHQVHRISQQGASHPLWKWVVERD